MNVHKPSIDNSNTRASDKGWLVRDSTQDLAFRPWPGAASDDGRLGSTTLKKRIHTQKSLAEPLGPGRIKVLSLDLLTPKLVLGPLERPGSWQNEPIESNGATMPLADPPPKCADCMPVSGTKAKLPVSAPTISTTA